MAAAGVAASAGPAVPAHGQPPAAPAPAPASPRADAAAARAEKQALNDRWLAAFKRRDWPEAEAALSKLCEVDADSYVPWYNLACVYAMSDRAALAAAALERAVALGFVDFHQLARDEHLAPIRGSATFKALVEGWRAVQDATIDAREARARRALGAGYAVVRDGATRTVIAGGFSEPALADARSEMAAVRKWWNASVAPAPDDSPADPRPDPWVLIILPTQRDFTAWAARNFGNDSAPPIAGTVGGIYDHDRKELVAMDLGATLRHEYAHVLHWRAMARAGQVQPTWVQEGLCSLVETVDRAADGSIAPVPCWRTNMARAAAQAGVLPRWEALFSKDADRFVHTKALGNYAAARAIMLFLLERGQLRAWYAAYSEGFAADPTGAAAMEKVFGKPLAQVERDFRKWLLALPRVPDAGQPQPAAMPFQVEAVGDGLRVEGTPADLARPNPGRGGLIPGDVITAVNGRPTRDAHDLARALAGTTPGDEASVGFRRAGRGADQTTRVRLVAPP